MNVTTLETPATTSAPLRPSAGPTSAPTKVPSRPRRRTGRGKGPEARPFRALPAPGVTRSPKLRPQACSIPAPAAVPLDRPSSWRLTDRGIALVLVTGLLIVTAALAVVGLTAVRVTGGHYSDAGHSVLAQP
jgi:hypothetical protein